MHLREVVRPDPAGPRADHLRPGRHRPGSGGRAVLVLLRLQRLERPARERLGDDPGRLRRAHGRSSAHRPAVAHGVRPARGFRNRRLGRGQTASGRRHPSGGLPRAGLARVVLQPAALARSGIGHRVRLRRHLGAGDRDPAARRLVAHRGADRCGRCVRLAGLHGALGRKAAGVQQRAHRTGDQDSVEYADRVGRGPGPPGVGRPSAGADDGYLGLLRHGFPGLDALPTAARPTGADRWAHPGRDRPVRLAGRSDEVAGQRAREGGSHPQRGPDPGSDVRGRMAPDPATATGRGSALREHLYRAHRDRPGDPHRAAGNDHRPRSGRERLVDLGDRRNRMGAGRRHRCGLCRNRSRSAAAGAQRP